MPTVKSLDLTIPPGSLWLVVVECRYDVVSVSPKGTGFFIPGQEQLWPFEHVQEWVCEIRPPRSARQRNMSCQQALSAPNMQRG